MDSNTLLDYALFQLTPTRTRCDLVVFCGGKNEKLASGLVEPFIAHLKFAKDQIPKGGYSITMRPPSTHAYWFTKATFQRFVRFVSTPEILERFMQLEREISQIESSIQSNECTNSNSEEGGSPAPANSETTRKSNDSFKANGEVEEANKAAPKENSKVHLQRLLDTRKALLRKEQAMAYARATVAGFEIDQLDDLIHFANSFGASRLREACVDFKELYKQKHTDGQWMDEVAAMKACTPADLSYFGTQGAILAYENINSSPNTNGSLDSTDSKESTNPNGVRGDNLPASDPSAKAQMQMSWQNQIPPYMYNFHGPPQQIPFAGVHPLQYYPAHMNWPQTVNGSTNESVRDSHKRSKKKDKSTRKEHDSSEGYEQTDSSTSDSGTDSDEVKKHERNHSSRENSRTKKHKKKSSKTVVIRNINYITSSRKNEEKDSSSYDSSSAGSGLLDEDSIKEQVDDAVAALGNHRNSRELRNKNRGLQDIDVENESNGYGNSPQISEKAKGNKAWDAFQNILMSCDEPSMNGVNDQQPLKFQDESNGVKYSGEKVRREHLTTDDSLLMAKKHEENETNANMVDFANGEDMRPSSTKGVSGDEHLLFSHKEPSGGNRLGTLSDFGSESSAIRSSKGEDWFVVNHSGTSETQEATRMIFDTDSSISFHKSSSHTESKRAAPIDDSFMVQSRPAFDDHYDSQWKTDIGMDADLVAATNRENGDPAASKAKLSASGASQPDDLYVVLARDPSLEPLEGSWQPDLDFGVEAAFMGVAKRSSAVEANGSTEENAPVKGKSANKKDGPANKDARSKVSPGSLSKSRIDALAKSKKMSPSNSLTTQKSKLEREEEMRKRMEELVIERQKRIAERSAAKGSGTAASKKVPAGSKTASSKISKVHTLPVQVKH